MNKVVMAGLLASTALLADTGSGFFVGVETGNSKTNGSYTYIYNGNSTETDFNEKTRTEYTAKVGYYFDQNNRVSLFYQHIDMPSSFVDKSEGYGVIYDYLIGSEPVKPFIGAIAGRLNYVEKGDLSGIGGSSNTKSKINGMVYGVQLGLNMAANEHVQFEVGLRYLRAGLSDTVYGNDGYYDWSLKEEIESLNTLFVGLNFKF